jgi:phosphatidylglycerophosphate synthase
MPYPTPHLVIDARPRGPDGPLAGVELLGRPVLAHLLELALVRHDSAIVIHARPEEHLKLRALVSDWPAGRIVFAPGPPLEAATILRSDRLYDGRRLRRAIRAGRDPESAVIWRLDRPGGIEGAEAELIRRQTYQPLGRYWALAPARLLARGLCPTRIRPNHLTLTSAALMLGAAATVIMVPPVPFARGATALLLALALVLDTSDGHLARLQATASEFGRWLDLLLDELCDVVLHAAIAYAAYARDRNPAWLAIGMAYGMGKYIFMVGNESWFSAVPAVQARGPMKREPARSLGQTFVRLAGHADVRWHLWIVLAALGRLDVALVAYAAYFPARALAGALRKAARDG